MKCCITCSIFPDPDFPGEVHNLSGSVRQVGLTLMFSVILLGTVAWWPCFAYSDGAESLLLFRFQNCDTNVEKHRWSE